MISVQHLQVAYGNNTIIEDLSVTIPKGKITALIGPNGCGKSTFLKALARINKAKSGDIYLEEKPLSHIPTKKLAQRLSLLPQTHSSPEGISVRKLVEYGRSPYTSNWGKLTELDHQLVARAMQATGVESLAEQPVESLSGGQRQRAWIAMVMAQDTDIVLLDEPTTYLDIAHQVELMNLMKAMNQQGKTVVVVLHDLNQACRYCDNLLVLNKGQLVAQGSPDQVFTESLLENIFDFKAKIIRDPVAQTPMAVAL